MYLTLYPVLFSNWNDGRELPGAVMHDEVMIGTESGSLWVGRSLRYCTIYVCMNGQV